MDLNNQEALWNTDTEYDYDDKTLTIYDIFGMENNISIEKWNKLDEPDAEMKAMMIKSSL